jgi:hypothetical protein
MIDAPPRAHHFLGARQPLVGTLQTIVHLNAQHL